MFKKLYLILNGIVILFLTELLWSDVIPSLVGVVINGGSSLTCKRNIRLKVNYINYINDDFGTIKQVIISENPNFVDTNWLSYYDYYYKEYGLTLSTGNGTKTVYVKFRDSNLKETKVFSDSIIYTAPAGVVINDYADSTHTNFITLTISTEGITENIDINEMIISENPSFLNSNWEIFNATLDKTFELSSGYGVKTIYVKFRNSNFHETNIYSDNVYLTTLSQPNIDGIIAYPNPCYVNKGYDKIIFSRLSYKTEIQIYNIIGELIKTITNLQDEGIVFWNLDNDNEKKVASGIYIYIAKQYEIKYGKYPSSKVEKVRTGKIVIIK